MNNPPQAEQAFHPSMRDEPEKKSGLYCFLNPDRVCGSECMAYVSPPDGPDYRDQQWANCLLLVNAHRGGKHLVVLASTTGELLQRAKNEAADQARNRPGPPSPTGRG